MTKQLKQMAVLSLTYFLVGPLLFWIEHQTMAELNVQHAWVQIVSIATAFWFFTLLELYVTAQQRAQRPQSLTGVYVAFKGARFLLSVMALLAYGVLGGAFILVFSINLIAFYLITMLFTTACYVRDEKKK